MPRIFTFLFAFIFLTGLAVQVQAGTTTVPVSNESELQGALTAAETDPNDTVININPGTYSTANNNNAAFSYTAGMDKSLSLIGAGASQVFLDGNAANLALILEDTVSSGTITIQGITVQNGLGESNQGGGAFVDTDGPNVVIAESQFVNNKVENGEAGTGLNVQTIGGDLTLNRNFIYNNLQENSGGQGGGAYLEANGGTVRLTNNIVAMNTGLDEGGGIFLSLTGASSAQAINNTFTLNNAALAGGGLYIIFNFDGITVELDNNILFNNTSDDSGDDGDDVFVQGNSVARTLTLRNNDIGEICFSSGGCDAGVATGVTATANINLDPLLVDPVNLMYGLSIGSPAVDAGTDTVPGGLPSPDFDGVTRPFDGTPPDMGALEALPFFAVDPTNVDFGFVNPGTVARQSITLMNNAAGTLSVTQLDLSAQGPMSLDSGGGANPCNTDTPTLAGGASCTMQIVFAPTDSSGATLRITFSSDDPSNLNIVITGVGNGGGAGGDGGGCALTPYGSSSSNIWAVFLALIFAIPTYFRRRN